MPETMVNLPRQVAHFPVDEEKSEHLLFGNAKNKESFTPLKTMAEDYLEWAAKGSDFLCQY